MRVYHPALDHTPPTVAEVNATADAEARQVIEDAAALAAARSRDSRLINQALDELERPPWVRRPNQRLAVNPGVTQADLARALFAGVDPVVAALPGGASVPLQIAMDHWRDHIAAARELEPATAIESPWTLRWILHRRRAGERSLAVRDLIGMLDQLAIGALAELATDYQRGEITSGEAFDRLSGALPGVRLDDVPPVYWDRHGGLEAIDEALAETPGAVICGEPGTGRTALIEAWSQRAEYGDGPDWSGERVHINPFWSIWEKNRHEWADMLESKPLIGYSPSRGYPGSWWEDSDWELAAEITGLIAGGDDNRVLVVATPAERDRLIERAPGARHLPVIEVPPLEPADAPVLWLCNAFDRELMSLARALACFPARQPSAPAEVIQVSGIHRRLAAGITVRNRWARELVETVGRERLDELRALEKLLRRVRGDRDIIAT